MCLTTEALAAPRAAYPAAHQSCSLDPSPTGALIDLKVRYRLYRQNPVCWLDLRAVTHLRITTVIPQRWLARRGNARGFRVDTEVSEDLSDVSALGNEGDQAHLLTQAGTATEISISWGQSWLAARHCGLSRKVSGNWRSAPPTGHALVRAWAAQVRAWVRWHGPAAPPQARHRL